MKKLILAIDEIQNLEAAVQLVKKIGHLFYAVKIHNLYDKFGPDVVHTFKKAGAEKIWVDFKLHDIPNTIRLRAASVTGDVISVHASGGTTAMKEAVASGKEVFAITAITSLSSEEIKRIYNREVAETVLSLAHLAKEAGVAGIVCSPREVKLLKAQPELNGLKLIVPGTRSLGVGKDDQARTSTPEQAIADGADFLVVGRQITQAEDPEAEARKLCEEIRKYK